MLLKKKPPVINCGIWISVIDFADKGSDKSKGLLDDDDDLNESVSGNFVRFEKGIYQGN